MARALGDLGQRVAVAADLGDLGLGVGIVGLLIGLLVRVVILVGLVLVVLRLVLILVVVGFLVVLLGGLVQRFGRRVGGGRRGLLGLARPGLALLRHDRVRGGLVRRVGHGQCLRHGDAGLRLGGGVLGRGGVGGDRLRRGGGRLRLDRRGLGLGGLRRLTLREVAGGGLGGEGLLHGLGVLGQRVGLDGRVDPRLVPDLGLILALGRRVRVLGAHGLVGDAGAGLG
ncbi:hypothetical protein MOR12E_08170, partial [Methylobacterium oryzae]